jgi:MtfA peptidase
MVQIIIVSIPVIVVVVYFISVFVAKKKRDKRRSEVAAQEFPEEWNSYLEKHFELFNHMPKDLQDKLRKYILVFIDEKEFMGSGGLELTDEMKVVVSAQALLLILGIKKPHFYPKLYIVELYPAAYKTMAHDGVTVRESVRLGESWQGGRLVLSWEHSRQGKYGWNDGNSVVLHEFAHRLDQLSGRADGAPVLDEGHCYSVWSETMGKEYKKLHYHPIRV